MTLDGMCMDSRKKPIVYNAKTNNNIICFFLYKKEYKNEVFLV